MKDERASMLPECHEGPQAFQQFDKGVKEVLSVPHSTLVRRERAYKKKVAASPKRRGPKQILKPSSE